jgi:hypothetical protein
MNLKPGLYRHYKDNDYFVFQVATHSETREPLVFYRCLYGDYSWWVRPLDMFTETVELAGETIPRFRFVRELTVEEQANYLAPVVGTKVVSENNS